MVTAEQAQARVFDAVAGHFEHSSEALTVDRVVEMIGLSEDVVRDALGALWRSHQITGVDTAKLAYPQQVTGVAAP